MFLENEASIKLDALKNVLTTITVSPETAEDLGIDPETLEHWVHQLGERLDDQTLSGAFWPRDRWNDKQPVVQLSQEEINCLLDGHCAGMDNEDLSRLPRTPLN